jgi:hypothetical protein
VLKHDNHPYAVRRRQNWLCNCRSNNAGTGFAPLLSRAIRSRPEVCIHIMHHSSSRPSWPLRYRADQTEEKPAPARLSKVLDDNIRLISKYREENEKQKSLQDHLADIITRWAGSMLFVYGHVIWFRIWLAVNLNLFGLKPFDPFPFGLLTTIVSLDAIFLSTFVCDGTFCAIKTDATWPPFLIVERQEFHDHNV